MNDGGVAQEAVFVNRVSAALTSLGYQVSDETLERGTRFDLIATIETPALGQLRIAIECKSYTDRNVGKADAAKFVHELTASGRDFDGALLVTTQGYTPAARAIASENTSLRLTTLAELHRDIMDPRPGLVRLVESYENSAQGKNFVELNATIQSEASPSPFRVVDHLLDRLTDSGSYLAFLLADFGAGKTTLLERMQFELAAKYLDSGGEPSAATPTPLLIRLRDYSKLPSVDLLVAKALREDFGREIPADLFWSGVDQGIYCFLLDGFDEMSGRADTDERNRMLMELTPLMSGNSSAVLTSRPSYFVQPGEFRSLQEKLSARRSGGRIETEERISKRGPLAHAADDLRDHLRLNRSPITGARSLPEDVETLELLPLSKREILDFISKYGASLLKNLDADRDTVFSFIREIYDLKDLAKRPILLEMLLETLEHGSFDLEERTIDIGPSQLYEEYTNMKLEWDWGKGETRRSLLTPKQRRDVAISIAKLMLSRNQLEVDLGDLVSIVRSQDLSPVGTAIAEIATDVATCAFITRSGDDRFRFAHKSFAEFFVARDLAYRARDGSRLPDELMRQHQSPEVQYFLGGFAFYDDSVRTALRAGSEDGGRDDALRSNSIAAILNSGRKIRGLDAEGARVDGLRLRQTHIVDGAWARVQISAAELNQVRFEQRDIKAVAFRACAIADCVLATKKESEITLAGCEVTDLAVQCDMSLKVDSSTVHGIAIDDRRSALELAEGAKIRSLTGSNTHLDVSSDQRCSISGAIIDDSVVKLLGTLGLLKDLTLTNCVLSISGQQAISSSKIEGSVVILEAEASLRLSDSELRRSAIVDLTPASEVPQEASAAARLERCQIHHTAMITSRALVVVRPGGHNDLFLRASRVDVHDDTARRTKWHNEDSALLAERASECISSSFTKNLRRGRPNRERTGRAIDRALETCRAVCAPPENSEDEGNRPGRGVPS